MVRISIAREGQFAPRRSACGWSGTNLLKWRATIDAEPHGLNGKGWVLDNEQLAAYFRHLSGRAIPSCEATALRAVRDLRSLCRKAGSKPSRILVSLSGIPDSWITAEARF